MDVALFGGEGFVGRNLFDLLSKSHNCVSIAGHLSAFRKNLDGFVRHNPYVKTVTSCFDIYIHLIDNKNLAYSEKEIAKNFIPSSHLILFSSAVIYANPSSEYGVRKKSLENFYKDYCAKNNINLTILRLFNIYGHYQLPFRQGSLIANILYNHINKIPTVINNSKVFRDFIFATDVANIVKNIIDKKIFGTYDLATGNMYSIAELLQTIESAVNSKLNVVLLDKQDVDCPSATNIASCLSGFTELQSGIVKALSFYEKNNELIGRVIKK